MEGNDRPTTGEKQTPPPIDFDLVDYVRRDDDPAALAAAFHNSFKKDYTAVSGGQERVLPYVTQEEIGQANNRKQPLMTNTLQQKYFELQGLSQFPKYNGLLGNRQYGVSLDPPGSVTLDDTNRLRVLADPTLRKDFINGEFASFKYNHLRTRAAEGSITGLGTGLIATVGLSIAARRLSPAAAGYARLGARVAPLAGMTLGAGGGLLMGNSEANSYLNMSVEKSNSILDYIKKENR